MATIGLALIVASVRFLDDKKIPPFPNCFTVIPTMGAALIILFGDKNTLIGRLISVRILRWIGLISYSVYLWHQPLLAFTRLAFNDTPDIIYLSMIIGIVFLLSAFSYMFVEQPFRDKKLFTRQQIFSAACSAIVITFILALFLIQTAANRSLLANKGDDPYLFDLEHYGNHQYLRRAFDILANDSRAFSNKAFKANKKIVLIGDSYARDFYNMMIEGKHLTNYETRAYFILNICQIYLGSEDRRKFITPKYRQTCTNAYDIKYALPLIHEANIIILASRWHQWSAQRLPMTLKLLNQTKDQQIFIIGVKHFGSINLMRYVGKSTAYRLQQFQRPHIADIKINDLLEKTIGTAIFVNVQKMICTGHNQTCPLFTREGKLISYDGAHLTKYGAIFVGNIIFKNRPLNKFV